MTTTITTGKRILRPKEAWSRLGVGRSRFYEEFVGTGRLRLLQLGKKSSGVLESEVDALIDSFPQAPRGAVVVKKRRARRTKSANALTS